MIIDPSAQYFVAFIDLLGFSNMVKLDLEAPNGSERFINKLYKIHNDTLTLNSMGLPLDLVQFSDSVVLATKYDRNTFPQFLNIITKYQYELFCQGILSRGGIAYGKHFYDNGFMFSLGLIEAYKIETSVAKQPRIVISSDLFELLYLNESDCYSLPVLKESDGFYFADYLAHAKPEELQAHSQFINKSLTLYKPPVREKYLWLDEYFHYKFPKVSCETPKFEELMSNDSDIRWNAFTTKIS